MKKIVSLVVASLIAFSAHSNDPWEQKFKQSSNELLDILQTFSIQNHHNRNEVEKIIQFARDHQSQYSSYCHIPNTNTWDHKCLYEGVQERIKEVKSGIAQFNTRRANEQSKAAEQRKAKPKPSLKLSDGSYEAAEQEKRRLAKEKDEEDYRRIEEHNRQMEADAARVRAEVEEMRRREAEEDRRRIEANSNKRYSQDEINSIQRDADQAFKESSKRMKQFTNNLVRSIMANRRSAE